MTNRINLLSRPPYFPQSGNRTKDDEHLLAADNFDEGLITDFDAARIPDNALSEATNIFYARGTVLRRNGQRLYSLARPNSNRVINIHGFYHQGTGMNILRFSRDKIYKAGSAGWIEITPSAIPAMTGSDNDPFSFTVGDNRCFITNNGIDPIREIDPTLLIYKALGNAPNYRYVTTAFNRVIGANRYDTDTPYEIGWSGDLNYGEWDNTVDISAGSTPLVDSPSDSNDDITGLSYVANMLIIPRIRSTWVGISQPSASAPFKFYPVLPKIGADIPRALCLTEYGLVWYNFQGSSLYVWVPSAERASFEEIDISSKVRRAMKADMDDPNYIYASYSADAKLYSLVIEDPNSAFNICWEYSFIDKRWARNEYYFKSCLADLDFASSSVTIDELTGTIDALAGTIDSLGGLVSQTNRFWGRRDGYIHTQTFYFGTSAESGNIRNSDEAAGGEPPAGFSSTVAFKVLQAPLDYLFSNVVRVVIVPLADAIVTLQYSRNDGATWTTAKSVTFIAATNRPYDIQFKKAIRFKRMLWRITTTGMISVNEFYVKALRAGVSKQDVISSGTSGNT